MLKHRDAETQRHTETQTQTHYSIRKTDLHTDRQTDRDTNGTDIHTSAPMMSNSTVLIMSLLATATHNAYKTHKI